jgi:hypothetical protein
MPGQCGSSQWPTSGGQQQCGAAFLFSAASQVLQGTLLTTKRLINAQHIQHT